MRIEQWLARRRVLVTRVSAGRVRGGGSEFLLAPTVAAADGREAARGAAEAGEPVRILRPDVPARDVPPAAAEPVPEALRGAVHAAEVRDGAVEAQHGGVE